MGLFFSSYSPARRPRDKGWPPGRGDRKLVSVEKLDNAIVVVPVKEDSEDGRTYGRPSMGRTCPVFFFFSCPSRKHNDECRVSWQRAAITKNPRRGGHFYGSMTLFSAALLNRRWQTLKKGGLQGTTLHPECCSSSLECLHQKQTDKLRRRRILGAAEKYVAGAKWTVPSLLIVCFALASLGHSVAERKSSPHGKFFFRCESGVLATDLRVCLVCWFAGGKLGKKTWGHFSEIGAKPDRFDSSFWN